jgi:ketosteroid isomerase-like protein
MFERFSEKARRVVFYARYEASQYGTPYIDTEYLLLGLLREDWALIRRFLGPASTAAGIRAEIEKAIHPRERIPTSVEVPLAKQCKAVLDLAMSEAAKLGHQQVGTEHILLGILGAKDSLAARLLTQRGLKSATVREQLAMGRAIVSPDVPGQSGLATIDSFLAELRSAKWGGLSSYLAQNVQFVDAAGRRWIGRDEVEAHHEALFSPYAKRDVTFLLEGVYSGSPEFLVASTLMTSILWENVSFAGQPTRSLHRMTILLRQDGDDWAIFLLQVTPLIGG